MTRRKRRNHSSAFKAKAALAAVKGEAGLIGPVPTWPPQCTRRSGCSSSTIIKI